jgi:hypothetical protein
MTFTSVGATFTRGKRDDFLEVAEFFECFLMGLDFTVWKGGKRSVRRVDIKTCERAVFKSYFRG